ncbi:MAG TPA: response regulator [Vicinamibacterales bacterium]|nr:response regulator [Vicinamibacterales bacterium]
MHERSNVLAPATSNLLALLADAHDDTRTLYGNALRSWAWRIAESADGRDALAKALSLQPQLIVTDTTLPGIGGVDLCRIVREDPITVATRVIVTADGAPSEVERARASGADAVLLKPCLPEDLAVVLAELFDLSGKTAFKVRESAREIADQVSRSRQMLAESEQALRRVRSVAGEMILSPPPSALCCPRCMGPLRYLRSFTGGVVQVERWDYFECFAGCGDFQFRLRTRKLKPVE